MCIDFYLLKKKMFISLTTHLGPSLQSVLYSHAPLGPVSLFHKPELKLQGHINLKVSFAHWVIFQNPRRPLFTWYYGHLSGTGDSDPHWTGFQTPPVFRKS